MCVELEMGLDDGVDERSRRKLQMLEPAWTVDDWLRLDAKLERHKTLTENRDI